MSSTHAAQPKASRLKKGILTFVTIGAVGAVGAFASTALLTDDVSLASQVAHGGTLAIDTDGDPSTFTVGDISNMKPGESRTGTVFVKNQGSIVGNLTVSTTFSSTSEAGVGNCFRYYLMQNAGAAGSWSAFNGTQGSVTNADAGSLSVGYPGKRIDVKVEMVSGCTIGSGLESTKRNVNNNNYYGSTDLADRNTGHATASLSIKFDLAQA